MAYRSSNKMMRAATVFFLVACILTAATATKDKDADADADSADDDSKSKGGDSSAGFSAAAMGLCSATSNKEICEKSMNKANSSNPKDLVKAAFDAAVVEIGKVIKESTMYKEIKADKMTSAALDVCEEVLDMCIFDLRRSFDKIDDIEAATLKSSIAELRNWLSATVAHKETCIDAFANTKGETGMKVTELLLTTGEMLSNALGMVTQLQKLLGSIDLGALDLSGIASRIFDSLDGDSDSDSDSGAKRQLLEDLRNDFSEEGMQAKRKLLEDLRGDFANDNPENHRKRQLLEDLRGDFMSDMPENQGKRQLLEDLRGDFANEAPDFVDHRARKLMAAPAAGLKPDITVAQDGSGQFKTIQEAVNTVPQKNTKRVVIFVKAGVYKEYVLVGKGINNVALIGEGPLKTIITGSKSFDGGTPTFHSGTLIVTGENFMAKDIAIENTIMKSQAVAMRINADMGVFYNVHFNGYQDTLYSHSYRQFYSHCLISGTIDYIFGDAKAIFQNCDLVVRKPLPNQAPMVTAQGRVELKSDGVIVIQNCHIMAEKAFLDAKPPFDAYLGRPWKNFSRTIIMQSEIDGFINPQGWSPWNGDIYLDTLYYAEWENRGDGANTTQRVQWKGIEKNMDRAKAQQWTAEKVFVQDDWIKKTGVPYVGGMMIVPKDPKAPKAAPKDPKAAAPKEPKAPK